MSATEKAQALMNEFRSTLESEEMKVIVFDEGGKLSAEEFDPFRYRKIPEHRRALRVPGDTRILSGPVGHNVYSIRIKRKQRLITPVAGSFELSEAGRRTAAGNSGPL